MPGVDSKPPGGMANSPMPSSSNPPAANVPPARKYLRPELVSLVRALAALPEPERSTVFEAANEQAQRDRKGPTLSWDDWESPCENASAISAPYCSLTFLMSGVLPPTRKGTSFTEITDAHEPTGGGVDVAVPSHTERTL